LSEVFGDLEIVAKIRRLGKQTGQHDILFQKAEDTFFSVKLNDSTIAKITKQSIVRKLEDEA
jgi:hypothetical protein